MNRMVLKATDGAFTSVRRRVQLFRALPTFDRWLLASAFAREASVRVGLSIAPMQALLRFILWRAAHARAARRRCRSQPNRVLWALRIASRRVPGSTCLSQALAAQWMLARYGYGSELRIGVARSPASGFQAHAWVELDGQPVVGGVQIQQYVPFPDLKSAVL